MLVPYWKYHVVERPFGVTLPLSRAEVGAIDVASSVVTDGAELVTNVASAPWVAPASLVATSRKWYVRPAVRPVSWAETGVEPFPEPPLFVAVFEP